MSRRTPATPRFACASTLVVAALLGGCETVRFDPAKATRPYPFGAEQVVMEHVQVFNDGDAMLIVNASVDSWRDFDVWLNQRYLHRAGGLAAGETLRIPLDEFWDVRGEGPFPGGLFRYYAPTPIRLVQLQLDEKGPLVGFRAIPTERELDQARLRKES
jgi:hypothetical protein